MKRLTSVFRKKSRADNGVVRLLTRCFWISAPLLVLIGLYAILDPFKVLWPHRNYYPTGDQYVMLNRDYVSFEVYKRNAPIYHYDSFIFGNSRSIFYPWKDWAKYTGSDRIFHFDASSESLLGIDLKLKFLDERCCIANCLIVLDASTLSIVTNQEVQLFTKHYALTDGSAIAFQWKFFRAFLDKHFLQAYFDVKLRHQFRPYMKDVLQDRVWDYDSAHNELSLDSTIEKQIQEADYYESRTNIFYPRDGVRKQLPKVIGSRQVELLTAIRAILDKHKTNYRIVISPLYDQVSLASEDMGVLQKMFGADKVFDFSGINDLTRRVENYYEESHYRPQVARTILREIYRESTVSVSNQRQASE